MSVQWVWPGTLAYEERHVALKDFTVRPGASLERFQPERTSAGNRACLPGTRTSTLTARIQQNCENFGTCAMAGLVCCSAFDIALHDLFRHL
ncbi:MAG: hypothetical protein RBT80_03655 [Candidatus Vecturithrix sp.]|nr:hypothetical protein [Candidatus Vecturithrix sp.]